MQAATGIAVLEDDDDGRGADDVKLPPKKNLKEAQQKKADPVPKTKADSNPADRATIDKGLSWLEGFKKMPNFTVDMLTVEWEAQADNIKSMPQEHQAELGLAKNKLELFLINREGGLKS